MTPEEIKSKNLLPHSFLRLGQEVRRRNHFHDQAIPPQHMRRGALRDDQVVLSLRVNLAFTFIMINVKCFLELPLKNSNFCAEICYL